MLIIVMFVTGTDSAIAQDPPRGLASDWARGVWDADVHEHPFTGFKGEDEYANPEMKVPHMPAFTSAYGQKYESIRAEAFKGRAIIDTPNTCAPLGVPVILGLGLFEIRFSKDRVTMISEEGGVRRIYIDGRGHPPELDPTYNGHSIAHWEGRTLVINTTGLRDDTYIELGMPHSDQLRVIERLTQTGPDTIENDVTLIDPLALSTPLHHQFTWTRRIDQEILEYFCTNNRDQNIDGATTIIGFDGKPLSAPAAPSAPPTQ